MEFKIAQGIRYKVDSDGTLWAYSSFSPHWYHSVHETIDRARLITNHSQAIQIVEEYDKLVRTRHAVDVF